MIKSRPITILIFSPSVGGGLAEHSYYQATALQKLGAQVSCLVAPGFLAGRETPFPKIVCLPCFSFGNNFRLVRKLNRLLDLLGAQLVLSWQVLKCRPDLVLLDSYVEYFSPLWVWPHCFFSKVIHIRYAANLHDPVRSFQIGPDWWHKLSVRLAYLPLDFVLVHDKLPEFSPVPADVRAIQVPVGIYEIRGSNIEPKAIRETWGIKAGQKVFLVFGYVRDGKNLDLAVQALAEIPDAFLVIAGSVASMNDRPFNYYRDLAVQLGVMERCRFFEGFVSDADLGKYFSGTDFVLLTYASSFHSQSGVLNIAARARKPVLASSAPSPLLESVKKFQLGVTVEPDSQIAVTQGMRQLISTEIQPRWDEYEGAAAWEVNARKILEAMDSYPQAN